MILRSRSRNEDLGEKLTQYFLNQEKRNYTSKVILKLINEDGEEFTKTPGILNCQNSFYKDVYEEVRLVSESIQFWVKMEINYQTRIQKNQRAKLYILNWVLH